MTNAEITEIEILQKRGIGPMKIAAITKQPIGTVKAYISRHPAENEDVCMCCGKALKHTCYYRTLELDIPRERRNHIWIEWYRNRTRSFPHSRTEIDGKVADLLQEAEVVTGLTRKLIEENAANAMDQSEFSRKYKGYEERYDDIRDKVEKLREQSEQRKAKADSISAFMFELHETDEPVTEFDSKLWLSVIDNVLVRHNGTLLFRFRNGMEIE